MWWNIVAKQFSHFHMILNGWFRWFIVVRNVGWNRRVFASLKSPISPRLLVNQRVFIAYSFISKTLALNCSQMRPNTKLKVWNTRSEKFLRFYAKCTFRLSQQSFAAFLFVRMQNKNRLAIAGGFSFNIIHSHVSAIRKLCKKKLTIIWRTPSLNLQCWLLSTLMLVDFCLLPFYVICFCLKETLFAKNSPRAIWK